MQEYFFLEQTSECLIFFMIIPITASFYKNIHQKIVHLVKPVDACYTLPPTLHATKNNHKNTILHNFFVFQFIQE